jgi:hypothetical protein
VLVVSNVQNVAVFADYIFDAFHHRGANMKKRWADCVGPLRYRVSKALVAAFHLEEERGEEEARAEGEEERGERKRRTEPGSEESEESDRREDVVKTG